MMVCVLFAALNGRTDFAMEFDWISLKGDAVLRKNLVKRYPLFAMLGVFAVMSRDVARCIHRVRRRPAKEGRAIRERSGCA